MNIPELYKSFVNLLRISLLNFVLGYSGRKLRINESDNLCAPFILTLSILNSSAKDKESLQIKKFKTLKNLRFIEFPKLGLEELSKVLKKISNCKVFVSKSIFDLRIAGLTNILLSILFARHLGPENFGVLNYLIAFIFLSVYIYFKTNSLRVSKKYF